MRTRIFIAAILLIAILFLTREHWLLAIGDFLVVEDKLQPADVIQVIAGKDHRTDYGIRLYKQGYGKLLFFVGGWCALHGEKHSQRGEKLYLDWGIPSEAVAIDDSQVTSTYSEVVRLREFIDQSRVPIQSVIVVSDPFHMWRARWSYRAVLGSQIKIQMAPVPFSLSPFQQRWWTDRESRRMVKEEYLKILYYYARYRLSWGPVKAWLASLDRK
jgi:uncharacterized SAM-binding protein YcdF (DUF218 family)